MQSCIERRALLRDGADKQGAAAASAGEIKKGLDVL